MSQVDWDKIKYFRPAEFDSPDKSGSGRFNMQKEIVGPLDYIRAHCGFPLIVTSGYRTKEHNNQVGGVDSSSHTNGYAADIVCMTSAARAKIIYYALEIGIRRMGIGPRIIHLDTSPFHPQDVTWLY